MEAIFLSESPERVNNVYPRSVIDFIKSKTDLDEICKCRADLLADPKQFSGVRYVFSSWGMPSLTEEELQTCLPNLEYLLYAAGSVQPFARPFLNRGIKVISAWAANAIPVAEYTTAQIILANKGFFASSKPGNLAGYQAAGKISQNYPGNYGAAVGIIGAGMIGTLVIRMLKAYHLHIKVFDPFLPDEKAQALGVQKCSLEELFSSCQVVSNHLANNAQTRGMLTKDLFAALPPYAAFLNTGRGAQVDEAGLVQVLQQRPDLTAILDVTDPEPPCDGHLFYRLPNCILTPHIAGSKGTEVHRMAAYAAEEFSRCLRGEPCLYEVSLEMLKTMA